jgi:Putative phage serine protease XkdF
MFINFKLAKLDEDQQIVYGIATAEVVDRKNEILDYNSSKPFFEAWSQEIFSASDGKSYGNIRSMHNSETAIGKLVEPLIFDDEKKQIGIVGKIIDPVEWEKAKERVYIGFSIGGNYIKRWVDKATNAIRFTARPNEISMVDRPCCQDALILMTKKDETEMNKLEIFKSYKQELEKALSASEIRERLTGALSDKIMIPLSLNGKDIDFYIPMNGLYPDYVIFSGNIDGDDDYDSYKVSYSITDDGVITIGDDIQQVHQVWTPTVDEDG